MKKIYAVLFTFSVILLFIFQSCGVGEVSDADIKRAVSYITNQKKNDEFWIREVCQYKCLGKNLKTTNVIILHKERPQKGDNDGSESYQRQKVLVKIEGTIDAYQNSFLNLIKEENYIGNASIEFTGLLEFRFYKSGDHWGPCYDLTKWNPSYIIHD